MALAIVVTAIVLAGVIAFLVCTDCFTNWNKYCQWGHDYGENGVCSRCGKEKEPAVAAEYFQIQADESADKLIKLAQIDRKAYSVMGIPASVESAYTLTATLEPSNSDNKRVVWSVEFANPDSAWASGKNPESYVKAQPTVDGSAQATVTCLAPFSEPINVVATSEDNAGATASCLCDYVKRIVGIDLQLSSSKVAFDAVYTVEAVPQYGDGTIEGTYAVESYQISMIEDLRLALNGLEYKVQGFSGEESGHAIYYATTSKLDINFDIAEHTFSFKGSEPYDVCGQGLASSITNDKLRANALNQLRSLVNNTFKQFVTSNSGHDMVFRFGFTYTYEGKSYVETTATANLKFDAETLAIHVVSLTLDNEHLVF